MTRKTIKLVGISFLAIIIILILYVIYARLSTTSNSESVSISSTNSHKVQRKLKYSKVNIYNADDDYVTYNFKSFVTHKVNITDNWSIAPATINKVEIAMMKKPKTLKVHGQFSSNPLPRTEKTKGFIFLTLNIPKAYSANLTVGIDGGAASFPKYNDIMLAGLIIPGQKGEKLANQYDHAYDIQGEKNFDTTTKHATLNIQKMLIAVPIPKSVVAYQPLKLRFNAHDDNGNSHLYQFKVTWR